MNTNSIVILEFRDHPSEFSPAQFIRGFAPPRFYNHYFFLVVIFYSYVLPVIVALKALHIIFRQVRNLMLVSFFFLFIKKELIHNRKLP